jgi:uncharacterized protein (TIGR02266 family)
MGWRKILLADDIDLFMELEKTYFHREGFQLLVARSGRQALEMAVAENPNLILMNLNMPEMAGDECCRQLKENPSLQQIPVLLVIDGDRADEHKRCREAACNDIVSKPINRHLFLQTAGRYLNISDRTAPRVSVRMRIHYGTGEQKLLANYSVNLSTGGVFIEAKDILPIETPLSLEFILPNLEKTIRCQGRVAWVNAPEEIVSPRLPPGMGIQFIDLKLDDLHALREFIKNECLHPSW